MWAIIVSNMHLKIADFIENALMDPDVFQNNMSKFFQERICMVGTILRIVNTNK
jgi:hypothetical protein